METTIIELKVPLRYGTDEENVYCRIPGQPDKRLVDMNEEFLEQHINSNMQIFIHLNGNDIITNAENTSMTRLSRVMKHLHEMKHFR